LAQKISLGIRREDKNPWERRVPLIPVHARELLRQFPLEIRIQPSPIRVFSDEDYRREGVVVSEDLSSCSIVLAVKRSQRISSRMSGSMLSSPIRLRDSPTTCPC